jgi:hypothetical protein
MTEILVRKKKPSGAAGYQERKHTRAHKGSEPDSTSIKPVAVILRRSHRVLQRRKPLAIGVRDQLLATYPTLEPVVDQVLAYIVNEPLYLRRLLVSDHRWNLDGTPSDPIKPGHKNHAKKLLKGRDGDF